MTELPAAFETVAAVVVGSTANDHIRIGARGVANPEPATGVVRGDRLHNGATRSNGETIAAVGVSGTVGDHDATPVTEALFGVLVARAPNQRTALVTAYALEVVASCDAVFDAREVGRVDANAGVVEG